MGEGRKEALRVDFDRSVKVEFHGANVTSDAGLLAFRELDEASGLTDMVADLLVDTRTGLNTRHTLLAQLRQSLYSCLAGYEDTNDAEQLCQDPSIRQVVGERAASNCAASRNRGAPSPKRPRNCAPRGGRRRKRLSRRPRKNSELTC